jgi:hypothetical protein
MGKPWARTPEQDAYLKSHFPGFIKARQEGSMQAFRTLLYNGWEQLWPERSILYPLREEGDLPLTKEQMAELGKAMVIRKKVGLI